MYIYAVIIIHNGRFRFLPSISSLTEQGTHLSLIKSYQLTFHLYSWLVMQF